MYQWLHTEVEEGRAGWYKAGGTKTEVYWWFGWKLDWTSVDQTGLIFGRQRTGEEANMMMGKKRTALVHFFSDKAYSNDAWSHPTPLGTLDILDKPDALRKVPDGAPRGRGKTAVWHLGVLPYSSDNVKIAIDRFFYLKTNATRRLRRSFPPRPMTKRGPTCSGPPWSRPCAPSARCWISGAGSRAS